MSYHRRLFQRHRRPYTKKLEEISLSQYLTITLPWVAHSYISFVIWALYEKTLSPSFSTQTLSLPPLSRPWGNKVGGLPLWGGAARRDSYHAVTTTSLALHHVNQDGAQFSVFRRQRVVTLLWSTESKYVTNKQGHQGLCKLSHSETDHWSPLKRPSELYGWRLSEGVLSWRGFSHKPSGFASTEEGSSALSRNCIIEPGHTLFFSRPKAYSWRMGCFDSNQGRNVRKRCYKFRSAIRGCYQVKF